MLTSALLLVATAQPALAMDKAIVDAVSDVYGKPVPEQAICVGEPVALPNEFRGQPVPVGVKQGHRGCTLIGVMVDGAFNDLETAAWLSIDAKAWKKLSAGKRGGLLAEWTTGVLLAFDQVDETVKPSAAARGDGGFETRATFWQRVDERYVTRHTQGVFYFNKDGLLETADREAGTEDFKTGFFIKKYSLKGQLSDAEVVGALETKGRRFTACFEEQWSGDYHLDGRIRLQWTVRDGKATQLAVADEIYPDLAKCYARVVRELEFPKDRGATIIWSFNVVRTKIDR